MIIYESSVVKNKSSEWKYILAGVAAAAVVFRMILNLPETFQSFDFFSPVPSKYNAFDRVIPNIQKIVNTYSLHKEISFVPEVHGASTYDSAAGYAVVDYDSGNVIAEKSIEAQLPIASLTKIMTAVVALDLASPNEMFTVTQRAADQIPTKIVVEPGERFTLEELLHASLMTSANDATEVIRDGIDHKYGGDIFIRAMNEKAKFIGLKNTRFMNPQGFDTGHPYSTAEDLAILSHYALSHYPLIDQIVRIDHTHLEANGNHKAYNLYNWNGLLGVYPGVYGIKIGNTGDAGMTTVVVAERNGQKILVVVLGAPRIIERDIWASQLLDLGFENTANLDPIEVTEDQLREKYATWQ